MIIIFVFLDTDPTTKTIKEESNQEEICTDTTQNKQEIIDDLSATTKLDLNEGVVTEDQAIEITTVTTTNTEVTQNGYHHFNSMEMNHSDLINQINTNSTNNKYDLNESTESTATSLFLNISAKIVTNGTSNNNNTNINSNSTTNSSVDISNESLVNNNNNNNNKSESLSETLTSSASLSPVSLTSLEPANKRARLSNS